MLFSRKDSKGVAKGRLEATLHLCKLGGLARNRKMFSRKDSKGTQSVFLENQLCK
jgi:hypothetical protein